ncbi:hypothetical protein [Aquicoccus sp.]|uniref:hypothetical protein n=1 Tax=Aquicoccus sp. TaxID=2055851 RepID=UPI00356A638A
MSSLFRGKPSIAPKTWQARRKLNGRIVAATGIHNWGLTNPYVGMSNEIMKDLGQRTAEFCKRHFGGLKPACAAAGLKYSTLHSQITNGREIPFSTIERLCEAAGVSLEAFRSNRAEIGVLAPTPSAALHRRAAAAYSQALRDVQDEMLRMGGDITVDDVLNWLHRNDGRLDDFDVLRERVDLFYPVQGDDHLMRPARVGRQSLAAQYFNIEHTQDYVHRVGQLSRRIIDATLASHVEVQRRQQYQIADIDFSAIVDGIELKEKYRRVMAPVQTPDGQTLTLVFAKLI